MLVYWGCHGKALQAQWLKQQKFTSSLFWKLEVQDQGVGGAGFSESSFLGWSPYVLMCLMSSWPSLCVSLCFNLLFLQGEKASWIRAHPKDLI